MLQHNLSVCNQQQFADTDVLNLDIYLVLQIVTHYLFMSQDILFLFSISNILSWQNNISQ